MRTTTASILFAALAAWACSKSETPPSAASNAGAAVLAPAELGSIDHVHALGDVYVASQPTKADLDAAKTRGVKTVIDLRAVTEDRGFDERTVVEGLGLEYVNLPFGKPEELTDDVFDRARELLGTAERPILLHCGSANRAGAVWIPWRVLDTGLTLDAALAEAKTAGLKTAAFEEKAKEYVARHAPDAPGAKTKGS